MSYAALALNLARRQPLATVLFAALVSSLPPAHASPSLSGARSPDEPRLYLTLQDCFALALVNNLELEIARTAPLLALADLRIARGAFDPVFSIDATYEENSRLLDGNGLFENRVLAPRAQSETYRAAMSGLLPTGTRWEIFGQSAREESPSSSEAFDTSLSLELTQPLLRGAGTDATLSEIRIARREEAAAFETLKARVAQLLVDVTAAYYELAFARMDYAAREDSLQLASQLLADNESRLQVGTMSPLDVTQARSELAARRQELIASELAIIEAENALRRLIYRDVAARLDTALYAASTPPPGPITFNAQVIAAAYSARPELRAAAERLEQGRLRLRTAKNQFLPRVDLRFSASANGEGASLGPSVLGSREITDPSWAVGVRVEVPWGFSAERGRRDRAAIELRRLELEFEVLRQDVAVEVSNAAGAVRVNEKRYAASLEAVRFARESLAAEYEKLRVGRSTTFLVTQLQRDLAVARSNELRSLADWHQAVVDYHRVRGAILEEFGVRFVEPARMRATTR